VIKTINDKQPNYNEMCSHLYYEFVDYNLFLNGCACVVLDIFNNYLRLRSTTTPTGKLHGAISK
jgi:hypothetical protein